jgi:hypothetical protein
MRISLSDIQILCVRSDDVISNRWSNRQIYNEIVYVDDSIGVTINRTHTCGIIKMIEKGLYLQEQDKPFKPFLITENDTFLSETKMDIDIPDNTDILYVGLSNISMNSYLCHSGNYYDSIKDFPEIVRIKHMIATHGIIICSAKGACAIDRVLIESYICDKPWYISMAFLQPYYNVYAVRKPWIYCNTNINTIMSLQDIDNPLPVEWLSKDCLSMKMINV